MEADVLTIENGVLTKCNAKFEHIEIPDGVTKIASNAFKDCALTCVSLPEGRGHGLERGVRRGDYRLL